MLIDSLDVNAGSKRDDGAVGHGRDIYTSGDAGNQRIEYWDLVSLGGLDIRRFKTHLRHRCMVMGPGAITHIGCRPSEHRGNKRRRASDSDLAIYPWRRTGMLATSTRITQ